MFSHFKKLGQQIMIYGIGDTVNKLIAILSVPLFTRYLTPADYGVAGILAVANTLLLSICDLGLTSGIARYFHEDVKRRSLLVSTAQIMLISLTLIIALIALPFRDQISLIFFKSASYGYIVLLSLMTLPLAISVSAPLMQIRLEEKPKVYTFFSLLNVISGLVMSVVFIVILRHGIKGMFESLFLNAALQAVLVGIYALRQNKPVFSYELFKKMFVFGSPFILNGIFIWVINWADRVILSRFTNLSEVGLYSMSYAVGMAIMLPIGAFSSSWMPFFTSVAKDENAKHLYAKSLTYYGLVVGFFVLVISIFGRDYFEFFTPSQFHGAYLAVPLIALAYAFQGSFSITAVSSFLSKKTIYDVYAVAIAMVVNIGLMFLLIPHYGRVGAAWATMISYFTLPITIALFTQRFYPIQYEYKRLLQVMIVGLGVYFLARFIYHPTWENVLLRLVIILIYPLVLFAIGFFEQGEIDKIKSFGRRLRIIK